MKESEQKQDCPYLDMPNGLHGIDYPQKFMRAKDVNKPGPNNSAAMKCSPEKVMKETMDA